MYIRVPIHFLLAIIMKIRKRRRGLIDRLIFKVGSRIYEANDNIAVETLPQFGNNPKN